MHYGALALLLNKIFDGNDISDDILPQMNII